VRGEGFEPSNPFGTGSSFYKNGILAPDLENRRIVRIFENSVEDLIKEFYDFCRINLRLGDLTAQGHERKVKNFFNFVQKPIQEITEEDIRNYLMLHIHKAPITYAHYLGSLKVFFRDFLEMGWVVSRFKYPKITFNPKNNLPEKAGLKKFYEALPTLRDKTLFLMFATTGLRCSEVLGLTFKNVNFEKRMVTPNSHMGKTKKSWVTFYNPECEEHLKEYLKVRKENSDKIFPVSRKRMAHLFKEISDKIKIHVTPQILRDWFCCEMGRLNIPDRYVDAFCGRVPRSVLARHYTDFSPERLKEIYDRAGLKVLS
jgi:integrase